jgi:hypothetical protein
LAGEIAERREEVAGDDVHIGGARAGKLRGPFEHAGDAHAAFVDGAFLGAERDGGDGFLRGAVVAAIPDKSVGALAGGAEVRAELADGAVHGGDLGETLAEDVALEAGGVAAGFVGGELDLLVGEGRGELIVERDIGGEGLVGLVRGAEPDDDEEGAAGGFGAVDEFHGFGDDEGGTLALELHGRAAVA